VIHADVSYFFEAKQFDVREQTEINEVTFLLQAFIYTSI